MSTLSTEKKSKYFYWNRLILVFSLLFSLLISQLSVFAQTTYYVANTGNDANNGTTPNTPFQNLAKVNNLVLQPGDQILFRRGDTFRGTLLIRRSGSTTQPIVFDAYGSGQKPVLSGSVPVTNWTSLGNNVWQASCSSCGTAVTGLYRSGTALPLGRYPNIDAPNKGYMTIRAHTEKYQIFSLEHLPDNIDWKGGEVVMRPTQWIIDRAIIDHQYGDALNLFNNSTYTPADGWGYFIQSHPATLDQNGEWYYNAATKVVRLFSDQTNPNTQPITATVEKRSIDMAGVSNVVVRNLQITQALNETVFATNVSSFTLSNNDVLNSGEDGLVIRGAGNNLLIENNRIVDVNNNGVWIDAYKNVTLKGNTIRRVGVVPGRGKGGDGHYNGVQSKANENVLIENNTVDSIGYNGVTFWINTTVNQNVISNYCMTKSDGGALYVWNYPKAPMTNIRLTSNIIFNGLGAPEGSFRREYSGANGIFMDECVENVLIKNNTIFNNHQWGVFLHGSFNINFTDNTLFDNNTAQFVVYHNNGRCPVRNDIVKRNIFVSKTISQLAAQYEAYNNDLQSYGVIDSNYYARPFNEPGLIRGVMNYAGLGGNYGLSDWQNFSGGHDLHSQSSPITYQQYKNDGSGGVNRINSTFDADINDWQLVYSRYNNAELAHDNTDRLDGGSLRVSFPVPSGQTNSYAQAVKRIGSITKDKTYILRFDAVASTGVSIMVYLRQYGPPYTEFDRRYNLTIEPTRKSYELVFTARDNDNDAIVMVQTDTEGPVFWIDNVRLQEGIPIQNNPDDFIKLFYNPTRKDSTLTLPAGIFRDVKNQAYANSVVLKPFSSIILLKDTISVPPADLSIVLYSEKRVLQVNEPVTMRLRVRNEGDTKAESARWTYRLPANSQFIDAGGQPFTDNVLNGTIQQLAARADTTFSILVRPTAAGIFRMAAQLTTTTSRDPDSSPNSGTGDGEDDASMTELRVGESTAKVFSSPNPSQRLLPIALSNQPVPNPAQADLSLRIVVSAQSPAVGQLVDYTLFVTNSGGRAADGVQLENLLPEGVQLVNVTNWSVDGRRMTISLAPISAGTTSSASFQVQVQSPGLYTNQAQISASNVADPDSTPGNGYAKGEDDQAQTDIRVR